MAHKDENERPPWTAKVWRWLPAIVTFVLPLAASIWVMRPAVETLIPSQGWPLLEPKDFLTSPYARLAHDIEGRLLYGTASGFGRVVALAAIALAGVVLVRMWGWLRGLIALFGAMAFGALLGWPQGNDIVRAHILDATLQLAESLGMVTAGATRLLRAEIAANIMIGFIGAAALLAAFAAVACPTSPQSTKAETARLLRQRMRYLQLLALAGAAVLVLLVAVNKVLLAWPKGLLVEAVAIPFGALASAAANFWGGLGSAILLCTLLPAYASLQWDIDEAAQLGRKNSYPAQQKWRTDNELAFAPTSVIGATLTTAAPLLTGPAIDLFGAFFKGH